MLQITDIVVRRAGRCVLDRVSLDAKDGEVICVVGPNGSGKTTLLEAIAGVHPLTGQVSMGTPLRTLAQRSAAFAFMPDEARLPDEMTVAALTTPLDDALAAALDMKPLLGSIAGQLSRGETKRVLLYEALVQRKPVSLLDEPFGAFDPLKLKAILKVVRDFAKTAIITVHQMDIAERIADRVLLLAQGRAVAFATVDELRERTKTTSLEAAFVNLLEAG